MATTVHRTPKQFPKNRRKIKQINPTSAIQGNQVSKGSKKLKYDSPENDVPENELAIGSIQYLYLSKILTSNDGAHGSGKRRGGGAQASQEGEEPGVCHGWRRRRATEGGSTAANACWVCAIWGRAAAEVR